MSFKDYSLTPSGNTELGDGTYIGPGMFRNKVRPAFQQLAADGKELYDETVGLGIAIPPDRGGQYFAFDADGNPVASSGTGADAGLRTDLAANTGSGLIGWLLSAAGAVKRAIADKLAERVTPYDFGAVGDGVTDDRAALQAMNDWVFNDGTVQRNAYADFSGNFGISGQLFIGPTALGSPNGKRWNVGGDLHLKQLVATFESVRIRNFGAAVWRGRIEVTGLGDVTFAARTCGVGICIDNSSNTSFTGGLRAFNFWFYGILSTGNSCDQISYGSVRCYDCGSGHGTATGNLTTYGLTGTWSAGAQSGSSGSSGQAQTLTINVFPAAAIETYETVGNQMLHLRIGGWCYFVKSWDRTAGTVTVFPWLDPADGASGTYEWVFGGGMGFTGGDGGVNHIAVLHTIRCGRGLADGAGYGQRVSSLVAQSCGTAISLGRTAFLTHIGTSVDAAYFEPGNVEQIGVNHVSGSGGNYGYINSEYNLDLSKCWGFGGLRLSDGTITSDGFGIDLNGAGQLALAYRGRRLEFDRRSVGNPLTSAATFFDQSERPRINTQFVDSQTVTLTVQDPGFNRLFGYKGNTWRYVGSGANGAPTGTFTFTPPTGGTINGGSANASVSFSGFIGPADFEIFHTDEAQLTWIVRCVAGRQQVLPASATPANNSQMTFELTSNTTLTVRVKGSDGTVRSVALTLA